MANADSSKQILTKVEKWLRFMGLAPVKKGDNRLIVRERTNSGTGYTLHFYINSDVVEIESFVWKNVSGSTEKVSLFENVLMLYNGATHLTFFGLVPLQHNEYGLVLRVAQNADTITIASLKQILECIHDAYTKHIPKLKEVADELDLKFDRSGHNSFKEFLSGLFRDD